MGFEWDEAKEEINIAKHGIDFIQAAQIFKRPILSKVDTRKDYGEERIIALGEYDGVILCVIYTIRNQSIRIISAWRAGKNERQTYKKACGSL